MNDIDNRYICTDCGAVFSAAEAPTVKYGFTDYMACPVCGAESIAEARKCRRCGLYFDVDHLDYNMCPDCAHKIAQKYEALMNASFSVEERRYLSCRYEGLDPFDLDDSDD